MQREGERQPHGLWIVEYHAYIFRIFAQCDIPYVLILPVSMKRGSGKETCPVLLSARSAGDLIAAVQPAATIGASDTPKAQQRINPHSHQVTGILICDLNEMNRYL